MRVGDTGSTGPSYVPPEKNPELEGKDKKISSFEELYLLFVKIFGETEGPRKFAELMNQNHQTMKAAVEEMVKEIGDPKIKENIRNLAEKLKDNH